LEEGVGPREREKAEEVAKVSDETESRGTGGGGGVAKGGRGDRGSAIHFGREAGHSEADVVDDTECKKFEVEDGV
jgi:hypothetical protein